MPKGDGNQHYKNGVKNFTELERFLQKIKINEQTGCWEWHAFRNKKGYGHFKSGDDILAHRVSYKFFIGDLDKKLLVCHKCDNPSCVSPFHLFLGTDKENLNDAQQKGRFPISKHPSSMSYKNGCRCDLCRAFLNATNMLSELKRKGIFDGEKFTNVQNKINELKAIRT